jgi:hypothetical protein
MNKIMRFNIILLLLLIAFKASAQGDSTYYYYKKATEAQQANDTASFYSQIIKAHRAHPYHPTIMYQAGVAAALLKKHEEAIVYLQKAIQLNANINLDRPEFSSLQSKETFEQIKKTKSDLLASVVKSDTAFIIRDRTLHIESIAKGSKANSFYCGSIHKRKIIAVDAKGNISDFTSSGQDGLTSVFAIKVDKKRNWLWACSSPMQEMENYDTLAKSAIYKYDLKSKKMLAKYTADPKRNYIFGDLTLDNNGNVFISDSKNNIIFTIDLATNTIEEFFTSKEFWNIQGVTVADDNKSIFVSDYVRGLYKLDLGTKQLIRLQEDFPLSTKSVDGLSFYNNSLIGIQNFIYPMRVTQYLLNDNATRLKGYNIIDKAHPAFNEPTIGFVDGDVFYYVANSLWSGYDDDRKLKPVDQLQDVVILKVDLKNLK